MKRYALSLIVFFFVPILAQGQSEQPQYLVCDTFSPSWKLDFNFKMRRARMFVVRTGKVVSESFFDHTLGNDEAGYTFVASSGKPMFSVYPNVTCRIPDSQQEGTYAMTYVDPSNRFMYFGCCREATPPGKM